MTAPTSQQLASVPERTITVRRCELRLSRFVLRGEPETYTVSEAMKRFAKTAGHQARMNVLKARTGNYLGSVMVENRGPRNFILVNVGVDGDISWLLKKRPEFELMLQDVYRVEDVMIPRSTVDLPPIGFKDQGAR